MSFTSTRSAKAFTMWLRRGMSHLFTQSHVSMCLLQSATRVLWDGCCISFLVLSFFSYLALMISCPVIVMRPISFTLRVLYDPSDCDQCVWV
jgi:hypothetical protein